MAISFMGDVILNKINQIICMDGAWLVGSVQHVATAVLWAEVGILRPGVICVRNIYRSDIFFTRLLPHCEHTGDGLIVLPYLYEIISQTVPPNNSIYHDKVLGSSLELAGDDGGNGMFCIRESLSVDEFHVTFKTSEKYVSWAKENYVRQCK